jgi:thiamine-phosphate pyrophosphorylase
MAISSKPVPPRPAPRLTLFTPPLAEPGDFARRLAEAIDSVDIAAVILQLAPTAERSQINLIKALAQPVQEAGAALLLDGHAELVARSGADGAHITGIEAFTASIGALKPDRIAGGGGFATRHDAMLAAEAGADYLMFGEPDVQGRRPSFDSVLERVTWWAEVFEAPCVGYAAEMSEIAPLVAAGADFVALDPLLWTGDPRGTVTAAIPHLALPDAAN